MINCTEINSAKEAPPKPRKPAGWIHLCGFRCAGCRRQFRSTQGSRFVVIGGFKRRVCGECGNDRVEGPGAALSRTVPSHDGLCPDD